MSFSADWLTLREPADHAARNIEVLNAVKTHFAAKKEIYITDLGCGTGSNLRGSYHAYPKIQHWTLVDYDEKLLHHARNTLSVWADEVKPQEKSITILKKGFTINIAFVKADLNQKLDKVLDLKSDLITAAAFFDLVSKAWLENFVKQVTKRNLPFYTCLTYDGIEQWTPQSPYDEAALEAFHAHQQTDKGFGLAAGFNANDIMINAFKAHHYATKTAKSPWVLTDKPLINALLRGSANAVTEAGFSHSKEWAAFHKNATQLIISHDDLFSRQL